MQLSFSWQANKYRLITEAVHPEDGKIALQILHAGRYTYHPLAAAPSKLRAPINRFSPRPLSDWGIRKTFADFSRCAHLAQQSGYDGVEIMGSKGYLIGQDELARFHSEWGIDKALTTRGGLTPPETQASTRQVWLLQRKSSKVGSGLAKTTGWIRRTLLKVGTVP